MTRATSRRTVLAGLAATPIAGLPPLADATKAEDPVLVALAELRDINARVDAAREINERAEAAYLADPETVIPSCVAFRGVEMFTISRLEHEFTVGTFSLYGLDSEVAVTKRSELAALLESNERVDRRHGRAEADEALSRALGERWEKEDAIIGMSPTTTEGAFAMLRFVAYWIDDNKDFVSEDEEMATAPARAIRRALAVLESRTSSGAGSAILVG